LKSSSLASALFCLLKTVVAGASAILAYTSSWLSGSSSSAL